MTISNFAFKKRIQSIKSKSNKMSGKDERGKFLLAIKNREKFSLYKMILKLQRWKIIIQNIIA